MKILIFIILLVFALFVPYSAFAQESLTVNPPFLKDGSDACSKLLSYKVQNDYWNDLPNHITSFNNTDVTTLYYNNTKLVVSFSPSLIDNDLRLVYETGNGPPPLIHISDSKSLPTPPIKKLILEHKMTGQFTEALTNIGGKKITVVHPSDQVLYTLLFWKNGTVASDFIPNGIYGYVMEASDTKGTVLEPGQSIINRNHSSPIFLDPDTIASPGNYTMRTYARVIGDVHGTCTIVDLWSQPVDLTILPQSTVPEFPFVIPIFLISFVSVIVFYRIKSDFKEF